MVEELEPLEERSLRSEEEKEKDRKGWALAEEGPAGDELRR